MSTRLFRRAAFISGLVLSLAAGVRADMVQLKDGRFVEGVPTKVDGSFLVLAYKNGDVRVPLSMVEDYLIVGAPPPVPSDDAGKEKLAQGFVPWKGKWVKPEVRDKEIKNEIAQRKAVIEEMRKHSSWVNRYMFSSKFFDFESTLPPEANKYWSGLMDAFFESFKKEWNLSIPSKGFDKRLKVCVYPDRETLEKIGGAGRGALAYYRFVPPRELNFFNARTDRRLTEMVMYHECTHYLVDLLGDGRVDYPHCFGEALAEYYGATSYDPRSKTVQTGGLQEGRLAQVKSDIDAGNMYSIKKYLETEGGAYEDYYWGWSFVHFMMSTPAYTKKFKNFFVDLAKAKDVQRTLRGDVQGLTVISNAECIRVFKDRMGIKDLAALEREWHDYVRKLDAPTVRGYESAGKRAFQDGRVKFRAPRLLKTAIDMGSTDVDTYTNYATCLERKGDFDGALKAIERACELDPLEAGVWASRGFLLRRKGDAVAGDKFVALAKEIDPDGTFVDLFEILSKVRGGDD